MSSCLNSHLNSYNLEKVGKGTVYEDSTTKIATVYRNQYSNKSMMISGSDKVARKIVSAANAKKPKARYPVGTGASVMVFMHTILPARAFDWIMKAMYEKGLLG